MAPHPETLFHLVPDNQVAHDALLHPSNELYVSTSKSGHAGLEVGYHVPRDPGGHVITRLGRKTDLILRESTPGDHMSAIHVAFEFNFSTGFVRLSVRSKYEHTVKFSQLGKRDQDGTGVPEEQGVVPGYASSCGSSPVGHHSLQGAD